MRSDPTRTTPAVRPDAQPSDLASATLEGLGRRPRRLPARLLYDAAGSALFEQITALSEYHLTRSELAIFERHANDILDAARAGGERIDALIELGAGSGAKTLVLLRALLSRQPEATYVPVDVSTEALAQCARALSRELDGLSIQPIEARYQEALPRLKAHRGRRLVLFIGSSIGNFEPDEAVALLSEVRSSLDPGDALLLGTDLVTDPARLVPAYDDEEGVTARFNLNLLVRLNRELRADFDLGGFRHVALWNEGASRVEMHLESLASQRVTIPAIGLQLELGAGERIHTESCYKFTLPAVGRLFRRAGLELVKTWTDPERLFGDHLARVA